MSARLLAPRRLVPGMSVASHPGDTSAHTSQEVHWMTQLGSVRPNAKQVDEWNSATGLRWLERHERIDRQIAPFGRGAMDRADIQRGQRGPDAGCGCGETTFELGRRV